MLKKVQNRIITKADELSARLEIMSGELDTIEVKADPKFFEYCSLVGVKIQTDEIRNKIFKLLKRCEKIEHELMDGNQEKMDFYNEVKNGD